MSRYVSVNVDMADIGNDLNEPEGFVEFMNALSDSRVFMHEVAMDELVEALSPQARQFIVNMAGQIGHAKLPFHE